MITTLISFSLLIEVNPLKSNQKGFIVDKSQLSKKKFSYIIIGPTLFFNRRIKSDNVGFYRQKARS